MTISSTSGPTVSSPSIQNTPAESATTSKSLFSQIIDYLFSGIQGTLSQAARQLLDAFKSALLGNFVKGEDFRNEFGQRELNGTLNGSSFCVTEISSAGGVNLQIVYAGRERTIHDMSFETWAAQGEAQQRTDVAETATIQEVTTETDVEQPQASRAAGNDGDLDTRVRHAQSQVNTAARAANEGTALNDARYAKFKAGIYEKGIKQAEQNLSRLAPALQQAQTRGDAVMTQRLQGEVHRMQSRLDSETRKLSQARQDYQSAIGWAPKTVAAAQQQARLLLSEEADDAA